MRPRGLTISQLAAHAGVTVRAIRHYHHVGLLAEPGRDASGYRRYDAQAVVDLIRIKTLAGAGVPLARVRELLDGGPQEFSAAVAEIDRALQRKVRELTRHRRRLAELTEGDKLFLPPDVVELIGRLRAIGVSERGVRIERDGWILAVAHLPPDLVTEWVSQKLSALSDPEFRRIYLACDEAFGWDPADPRLEKLAGRMATWTAGRRPGPRRSADALPAVFTLMAADIAAESPAWRRLTELGQQYRQAQGQS
jgi:DNA-binding transcriptional MerR regulator